MWSFVSPKPFSGMFLDPVYAFKQILVKPVIPYSPIKPCNISIVLWLARLDGVKPHTFFPKPEADGSYIPVLCRSL